MQRTRAVLFSAAKCRGAVSELGKGIRPVKQYDAYVSAGKIRADEYQRQILGSLDGVYQSLVHYEPIHAAPKSWWSSLIGSAKAGRESTPKGIYLWGDVGCGKTMLMDLFYTTVPPHLKKHRVHFHAFMQDIHKRVHSIKVSGLSKRNDPLDVVVHEVANKCDVLCLDEMQVTDIADAMMLRHLFEGLYDEGTVTFFTSNRVPGDLYMHGVQRESFVPAIKLIEAMNHVVYLKSPVDYRKLPRPAAGVYYFGDLDSNEAKEHADKWFEFFADMNAPVTGRELHIWGRPVPIPLSAANKVMRFTFKELCGTPRSAADYLELCRTFEAIVVTDIPSLSLDQRDVVRRFITFLDAAYDSHIKMAVTAMKPFENLFTTNDLTIDPTTNRVVRKGGENDILSVSNFSGHEEMFAFARALSRLKQMSSELWLDYNP